MKGYDEQDSNAEDEEEEDDKKDDEEENFSDYLTWEEIKKRYEDRFHIIATNPESPLYQRKMADDRISIPKITFVGVRNSVFHGTIITPNNAKSSLQHRN